MITLYGIVTKNGAWYFGIEDGKPVFTQDHELAVVFRTHGPASDRAQELASMFPDAKALGLKAAPLPM